MNLSWRALVLLPIAGCISLGERTTETPVVSGGPEVITPQRPPSRPIATRTDIPVITSQAIIVPPPFDGDDEQATNGIGIRVNGQKVIIPLSRNGEVTPPVTVLAPIAGREASSIRNPSFQARLPRPAHPYYIPLSSYELTRRTEIEAVFQNASSEWAASPARSLGRAAAILRANPRVAILVTGYALTTEPKARALALARAEAIANELARRGVGSGRIRSEARLVMAGRASGTQLENIQAASRRAEIKVIEGRLITDPFTPAATSSPSAF